MRDETAKWVLEDKQPGLVATWFTARASEVRTVLDRAENIAYGGLPDGLTPADVVSQLEACWRDAAYIEVLAKRQYDVRTRYWPSDETSGDVRALRVNAKRALEDMGTDVFKIGNIVREARDTMKAAAELTIK
jgi:hypothetical protein